MGTNALLDPSLYIPDLAVDERDAALRGMVERLHTHGTVRDPAAVLRLLIQREALGSTAIGKGVAVPHARSLAVASAHLVFARSPRGIDWAAPDGEPVRLVFLLLAPDTAPWHKRYLDLLAELVSVVRLARNRNRLLEAGSFEPLASVLRDLS